MKHILRFAVCALLCTALLTANICVASAADSFLSQAELLTMKNNFEKDAGLGVYTVAQGACTDGQYAYFAMMQGSGTILKYDINTWKLVDSGRLSNVGHGNDIAYNADEDVLVIANNAPYYNIVTLVDPHTLQVIRDVELKQTVKVKETVTDKETGKKKTVEKEKEKELKIYSISYNEKLDRYVVGVSGTYEFALLDRNFKQVSRFKGVATGYTRQGCDCDDDYIYFVQSGGSNNILVIYDYAGKHVATVPIGDSREIENLFHIGKTFYTSMYYYGNTLQRIGFSQATRITYHVYYDANGGEGTMDATTVHYGDATPLRKNTFTKDGYFFGGWVVQRGNDGRIVGYRNGAEDYEWLKEEDVFDPHLYEDEQKVSKTVKNGNVKLSAFWIADEYEVRFESGEGEGSMEPFSVGYNAEVSVPESSFTKEGYVFDGYTVSRDVDGRVYGFRENSGKAEWLEPNDMARARVFDPGELFSRMTYDGGITLTARFRYAYTFSDDGSELVEYVGVDEKVRIPDNGGALTKLDQGAFRENETITELYIPAGVDTIERLAITDCPRLNSIYFEGALPKNLDDRCVRLERTPVLYREYKGMRFCIGFFADADSVPLIRCHASSLERNIAAKKFDKP